MNSVGTTPSRSTGKPPIWDVHCHFPRNWEDPDNPEYERLLDERGDALRAAGVVKASLLSGGRFGSLPYEAYLEFAKRDEDLWVPSAVVDPGETSFREIKRLHEMGYQGLKIIGTKFAYDDPRYFPAYAAAEEFGMPILMHLGVIGGGVDYAITHPRRDPKAAATYRRMQEMGRMQPRDVSAIRMRPFHLDTIANNFPALRLIGAHMGGTGNYDEAASVTRWRHHVFLDMSGGDTIERHAVERKLVKHEIGVEKLTWGSDCNTDEIASHVEHLEQIFVDCGLDEDEADRIRYRNAAEIFGFEQPTLAAE
ncbi:MAG: amidohydrolase family protein [Dehalococcoidia bacterium]|nr:amidohydrolase family protein [Dehalococcoidia bacterium]